jgi:hypothetical protein
MNDTKDLTEFKMKLPAATSEKLCEVVVASRYLGIMHEEAIFAMQELSRRRDLGDEFNFENKIEEIYTSLPKFKLDMKEIMSPKLTKLFGMFK